MSENKQYNYRCPKCKRTFSAMHFSDYRLATGSYLRSDCCGEVACFLGEAD
jgi:hypothetical protein